MYKITRKFRTGIKDYNVYSIDECKSKGLEYKYWKECSEGDYGESDDGYIGECIKVSDYDKARFITMSYGVGFVTDRSKIKFLKNHSMGIYTMINPKHWIETEIRAKRFDRVLTAYMAQLMSPNPIDWNVLGNIYRPDQEKPAVTVKKLFKQEKVQTMVKDELKKILSDKGISESFVLDTILDAIEVAKTKQDAGNMLKASSELSDYLQMKPDKKIQTERLEVDVTKQISDTINKESKRLVAQREVEIDE
tara:strand:+ start:410 stop:1159 length:750 start_codon:yes stop_codon:yes gene_type:complete